MNREKYIELATGYNDDWGYMVPETSQVALRQQVGRICANFLEVSRQMQWASDRIDHTLTLHPDLFDGYDPENGAPDDGPQ